jgi:hypothetical protein
MLMHIIYNNFLSSYKFWPDDGLFRPELLNPLTPELNPSVQRHLPRFLLGILIVKELAALHLHASFCVKGLMELQQPTCDIFHKHVNNIE